MTVIRPNSISGINSITAQSSALNYYDSAGNKLAIDADITGNITGNVTGNITVGTGATISGTADTIIASTNGSERLRITSGGNVNITNGNLVFSTSGTGIDFSATAGPDNGTGTSELLEDYEEGTWTPAAFLSYNPSGTKSVSTGGSPTGQYVKVGKVVTAWFYLPYTLSGTGGYNMGMNGLPFTADNILTPMCGGARESSVTGTFYQCESVIGTTIQVFRRYDNGAAYDGTGTMYGFIIYRAA